MPRSTYPFPLLAVTFQLFSLGLLLSFTLLQHRINCSIGVSNGLILGSLLFFGLLGSFCSSIGFSLFLSSHISSSLCLFVSEALGFLLSSHLGLVLRKFGIRESLCLFTIGLVFGVLLSLLFFGLLGFSLFISSLGISSVLRNLFVSEALGFTFRRYLGLVLRQLRVSKLFGLLAVRFIFSVLLSLLL